MPGAVPGLDDSLGLVLLGGAAFAAGAINAVAGGGSLISFPAALAAGLSPVTASATNTLALVPALLGSTYAYRRELSGKWALSISLLVPACLGTLAGALLLLEVPERVFELVVPFLVFAATLVVLLKSWVVRWASTPVHASGTRRLFLGLAVGAVAVYGGYFGAGIGIVLLGILAALQRLSLNEMNALKCLTALAINAVAAVYFVLRGAAALPEASVMALGSVLGGYGAAKLARLLPQPILHALIVCIGLGLSATLILRYWD